MTFGLESVEADVIEDNGLPIFGNDGVKFNSLFSSFLEKISLSTDSSFKVVFDNVDTLNKSTYILILKKRYYIN